MSKIRSPLVRSASAHSTVTYRVIHPLVRQVLKMRIWGVPLAGGLLLWLITALAGPRNLSKNLHQNIANEWMNNAVCIPVSLVRTAAFASVPLELLQRVYEQYKGGAHYLSGKE